MQNYIEQLKKLKQNSIHRTIKDIDKRSGKYIYINSRKLLNLSSNDYLNISTNKDLKFEFIEKYKTSEEFLFSSASARLLGGSSNCYKKLEKNTAKLFKKEAALIFNTGYQCNQGIISTLASSEDVIFSDKLNHASIVAGLMLSPAKHCRYKHLDIGNLEFQLKKYRNKYKNALIISESVFSMDGDEADIKKLVELKEKYNCLLMLDEAHAFGVRGKNLTGLVEEFGLSNKIDIITVTFGKALGSMGAICLSNNIIIDYLINKARSFIYSTAIPPVNILWSNFLLEEKFDFLTLQKEKLKNLAEKVHEIYPSVSSSHIIPVIIGEASKTKERALELQEKGYYVLPVNPPTVPDNTSRIRISLTADIDFEEVKGIFI